MTTKRNVITGANQSHQPAVQQSAEAILLSTYLARHYDNQPNNLAKATKDITTAQIKRWLSKDAVVINGAIYLKASKLDTDKSQADKRREALAEGSQAVDFNEHLRVTYGSNQSHFAEDTGLLQQQVNRWTQRPCVFLENNVYRKQRDLFAKGSKRSGSRNLH